MKTGETMYLQQETKNVKEEKKEIFGIFFVIRIILTYVIK